MTTTSYDNPANATLQPPADHGRMEPPGPIWERANKPYWTIQPWSEDQLGNRFHHSDELEIRATEAEAMDRASELLNAGRFKEVRVTRCQLVCEMSNLVPA